MKGLLVSVMVVLSAGAHFTAFYWLKNGFGQSLSGVDWALAVEPWLSLSVPIGFIAAAITVHQSRHVVACLCVPFFTELSISYSIWPPYATPLWLIKLLLSIIDSMGIRIDDQRQPVFWAVFRLLDCCLASLVPLLLAWMFAGLMRKLLLARGLPLRISCAVAASLVGLWLYYLPWVMNNALYGGGSGTVEQPHWFWDDSGYVPWSLYDVPLLDDWGVVFFVMPTLYSVGLLLLIRAWRKQSKIKAQ